MAAGITRVFKDKLFKIVFGENKANALALYNAINGTSYTNVEDVKITTIDGAVYIGMKNDVSILFDNVMSLYEHQSTYNPNMPLRGLEYFAILYSNFLDEEKGGKMSMFRSTLVQIPTPRYLVFYNGKEERPERLNMKLSDAYSGEGDVEVTAHLININYGKNKDLIDLCKPLQEYCEINNKIRRYQKEKYSIEEAVEMAVEECLQEGILEDILMKEKNRVISSLLTELTEEEKESVYTANGFEDGFDKGMKEGMEKGMERVSNLFSLLIKEGLSDDIEKALHDSEHLERLLEKYNV